MIKNGLNVLNVSNPNIRTLHFSWVAFFITFVVWFNHAPMASAITGTFDLTDAQWKALLILNVALTIPARVVVGMLVDRLGPRKTFSSLLMISGVLCALFASAQTYEQLALARFAMGFVGAGFVIGIRLVGEWFPARQVGLAEGIYGGWGNFGSAAAALSLPSLALAFGGENGWRYALYCTAVMAFLYGVFFYVVVRDTPKGATYFKPKKSGGLEVSTPRDFYFLIGMTVPMYAALAVLVWKLSPGNINLLGSTAATTCYVGLVLLFVFQVSQIHRVNREMLANGGVDEMFRYKFKQVAILDLNYFVTFGSELAVVSMLPLFFMKTFGLSAVTAGLLASGFAFMNLVARPAGGLISDKFGRRKSMLIFMVGLAVGYSTMSMIDSTWSLPLAVIVTMLCSFFVQSGEGAVFAIVPLVQRRMTGQIAGMAGAYGNVGAVVFLTIFSFVDSPSTFFLVIASSSSIGFIATLFLDEPSGHTAEVLADGSVELIKVD
ncbi:MAG: NarK family nitrate/nitrite MFS transporter [Akkermansiaceae bacterium]